MAQLQRHPSLRFSVFEAAYEIGLGSRALDGFIDTIAEEEESEQNQPPPSRKARTESSDDQTDSSFPQTPPSSNAALYRSPKQLDVNGDGRPRYLEDFSSSPKESVPFPAQATTVPIIAPRPIPGKLRKPATPQTVPVSSAQPQQKESTKDRERERPEKRAKEPQAATPERSRKPSSTEDDRDKKGFTGLLRFRTKSKERKVAAKEAQQMIAEMPKSPPRPRTPPVLPIAHKFSRPTDEVSFRPPPPRDSAGSSHGGTTSQGSSIDGHEVYPRPRDRSSRFERPHPAWRTAPATVTLPASSSMNSFGMAIERDATERKLPAEIHKLPPGQTEADRKPARHSPSTSEVESPAPVNMEVINEYYRIPAAEVPVSAPPPQSRFALHQGLTTIPLSTRQGPASAGLVPPSTESALPSRPSSTLPFIVPSPTASQLNFDTKPKANRSRRAGITFVPPDVLTDFTPPRRLAGAYNPPPTPPPTTGLPPTPTQLDVPQESGSLRPYTPPSRGPSPLGLQPPTPGPRPISPAQPSPNALARPGTAPQQGMGQRGKTPAFPTRPPGSAGGRPTGYLLTRRPDYDSPPSSGMNLGSGNGGSAGGVVRGRKVSFDDNPTIMFEEDDLPPLRLNGAAQRKRSTRRATVRQSVRQGGYDSDDTESRYSRDTYYNSRDTYYRDTFVFDRDAAPNWDEQSPPLPVSGAGSVLQTSRSFSDLERERTAGRERLVKMLVSGGRSREV